MTFEFDAQKRLDEFKRKILIKESIRFAKKLKSNAIGDLLVITNLNNYIELVDLIIYEYIKMKYPYMIDYFKKTIPRYTHEEENTYYLLEKTVSEVTKENKEKKSDEKQILIEDIINNVDCKNNYEQLIRANRETILKLVELFAHIYYEEKPEEIRYLKYSGTSSNPYNLELLLSLGNDYKASKNKQFSEELNSLLNDDIKFVTNNIESYSLKSIMTFLSNYTERREYAERVVKILKSCIEDYFDFEMKEKRNPFIHLSYQQKIINYLYKVIKNQFIEIDYVDEVIQKEYISSTNKLILLDQLWEWWNEQYESHRGSNHLNPQIEFKIEELIKLGKKIHVGYRTVHDEIQDRYLDDQDIQNIFITENNPFYTLINYWSGFPEESEISKIHKATQIYVYDEPTLYKLWDLLEQRRGSFELEEYTKFVFGFNVYMPLKNLIEKTKNIEITENLIKNAMDYWNNDNVIDKWENIVNEYNYINKTLNYKVKVMNILNNILTEINENPFGKNINYIEKLKDIPQIRDDDFKEIIGSYLSYLNNKGKKSNFLKESIGIDKGIDITWENRNNVVDEIKNSIEKAQGKV